MKLVVVALYLALVGGGLLGGAYLVLTAQGFHDAGPIFK